MSGRPTEEGFYWVKLRQVDDETGWVSSWVAVKVTAQDDIATPAGLDPDAIAGIEYAGHYLVAEWGHRIPDPAESPTTPPAQCGQVWRQSSGGLTWESMVTSVLRRTDGSVTVEMGGQVAQDPPWPPPGASLIAGPGAPWGPE